MTDMEALYALCGMSVTQDDEPEPDMVRHEGTFCERIGKCLEGYKIRQMEKALAKGLDLYNLMFSDDEGATHTTSTAGRLANSKFQRVQDLEAHGYIENRAANTPSVLVQVRIGLALEVAGLDPDFSEDTGNNSVVKHELHIPSRVVDGKYQPPNIVMFEQVVNAKDGVLVAYENLSPLEANRLAGRGDFDVPELRFWSDVAFLQWKSKSTKDSELKYVLRYNVLNIHAESILTSIHLANNTETMPWPGICYDATSLEGQALLGSPNGSGVAYMLIQHKQELGHKTIEKITVFRQGNELMLLFHVVGVVKQLGEVKL